MDYDTYVSRRKTLQNDLKSLEDQIQLRLDTIKCKQRAKDLEMTDIFDLCHFDWLQPIWWPTHIIYHSFDECSSTEEYHIFCRERERFMRTKLNYIEI